MSIKLPQNYSVSNFCLLSAICNWHKGLTNSAEQDCLYSLRSNLAPCLIFQQNLSIRWLCRIWCLCIHVNGVVFDDYKWKLFENCLYQQYSCWEQCEWIHYAHTMRKLLNRIDLAFACQVLFVFVITMPLKLLKISPVNCLLLIKFISRTLTSF